MRSLAIAAVVALLSVPLLAQNELPPSWSSSQGESFTHSSDAATRASQIQSGAPLPAPATPPATTAPALTPQPVTTPRPPSAARPPATKPRSAATSAGVVPGVFLDISTPLDPSTTPVYEGNPPIQFSFTADMNKGDALDLSLYSFGSHTGTHVDAPLHFLKGGATIDQVPLSQLVGLARVIDIDPRANAITAAELERYPWRGATRILFRTRNSDNNWLMDPVFHREFVYLAPDAAQMLADAGVELVGIDYLSIEKFGAAVPQAHLNLLRKGCVVAEGLDLRDIQAGDYMLTLLPLRIIGHEAAPARAMLQPLR